MIPVNAGLLFLAGFVGSTCGVSLHDFSYGVPYLPQPIVQSAAYVPALSHYQTHVRHGPTFRQIRAADWFDPRIPAFQTTLYAPAAHHGVHFGAVDGGVVAPSFRQDLPLTDAAVGLAAEPHPAVLNALAYTGGVVRLPAAFYGHSYDGAVYNVLKKA